jgi:GNAT superfamily N-acetyltransferase
MAPPASKPPPDEWAPLLTETPRRNLRRAMRWSENLRELVDPAFPQMPAVRTRLIDPSGLVADAHGHLHLHVTLEWRRATADRKEQGEVFGSAQFELHGDAHACIFDNLRLSEKNDQRRGIGRLYLNTLIKLCHELDITLISLFAQDAGRFVWAREGFAFADDIWRDNVVDAAKYFAEQLGIVVPIDLDTVEHPSEIANIGGAVPLELAAWIRGDTLSEGYDRIMTIGEALLLGPRNNDWEGELNLAAEPFRPRLAV